MDRQERLNLVNQIFNLYVQCYAQKEEELTAHDLRSFEDLLVIAVEVMNDVKVFDQSVLNPFNFIQLQLTQFGLAKSPESKSLLAWQAKIYGKLGLTSLLTQACERISKSE